MALLISFLIGIQLFHAVAPVSLPHFHSPSCNSPEVKAAAEAALNEHNAHRTEGYVIGLQRIFYAQEAVEDDYSFFNLLLDVLETRCHVRSRKSYKECEFRDPHETVFGQCKIIIRFDRKSNDSIMYKHDCTLQPVFSPPCPGCPISENVSEGRFREIAKEILAKFNAENRHIHYFGLVDVTKASTQVVSGILTTVEFTIQETACPKKVSLLGISRCPPLHFGTPEEALCRGSVINKGVGNPKSVSVNCDFFPHMSAVTDEQAHPHVNATETSKENEKVGQVANHHPSSKRSVPEEQEQNPAIASPEQEDSLHSGKTPDQSLSPHPRRFLQSTSCPGDVAIEIRGLQLPSSPQAKKGVLFLS